MYGLWFNLLGLNSCLCTIRNPNTTSTSKSLYIYRVLNVFKKQKELINKIKCFEQQARWLLFLSLSLFFIFSSFFLGLLFTKLFTQPLNSLNFPLILLLSYPKPTTTKRRQPLLVLHQFGIRAKILPQVLCENLLQPTA